MNIAPHSLTILSTTNTEFSFIQVWFAGQNSESLDIEDAYIVLKVTIRVTDLGNDAYDKDLALKNIANSLITQGI